MVQQMSLMCTMFFEEQCPVQVCCPAFCGARSCVCVRAHSSCALSYRMFLFLRYHLYSRCVSLCMVGKVSCRLSPQAFQLRMMSLQRVPYMCFSHLHHAHAPTCAIAPPGVTHLGKDWLLGECVCGSSNATAGDGRSIWGATLAVEFSCCKPLFASL
jgi:hypothetical protein